MHEATKIFVAGHRGLVGSAIVRALERSGFRNIVTRTHDQLDLRRQSDVEAFFAHEKPEAVVLAAAKVGGIHANNAFPAEFIGTNLLIQTIAIDAAYRAGVGQFLFLGSSCIYPKFAPQPIQEEALLTAPLEPTNEAYAVAKIAGIKMCQFYSKQYGFDTLSVMPTNLYGPGDNFDLQTSHVLPAMIRKFHDAKATGAKSVPIWGDGSPRREFLHVDDLADACVYLMKLPRERREREIPERLVNIGFGEDITIRELAETVRDIVGASVGIDFDPTKPNGTPRKMIDSTRVRALGWKPRIPLHEGIRSTYDWYLSQGSK